MEDEEREAFMADLGLSNPGLDRLIQATYTLLGLQTYYTAGPKEIRAWTIHKGDKGPKAASVIHTDFEKGFIRAEVYSVDELQEFGSETAIKARRENAYRRSRLRDASIRHLSFPGG